MDISPQGTAEYPCKVYDYIYTGKNNDIIDFDIHFEMLYFNAITAYRDSLKETYTMATDTAENAKSKNPENYTGSDQDPNAVMPNVTKPVVMISKNTTSSGTVTAREVAISDLEESLMTLSQADMMNVKLKIIGDPHFIKQDDVFYSPRGPSNANTKKSIHDSSAQSKTAKDPRLTPNNSIITDNGQVYVHIQFRTPIDIDESTGLMRYDSKYKLSVFSGLYMILRIDSQFSNGQFIQTLDLVRLANQIKFDYVQNKAKAKSVERKEDANAAATAPAADSVTAPNTTTGTGATDPAGSNQSGQEQKANVATTPTDTASSTADNKLKEVDKTANTAPISDSTKPQAVVTPPDAAKLAQLREKERDLKNDISIFADTTGYTTQSVNFMRKSATAFDSETAKNRQAIIDATASFGADAPIIKDFERTIARNEKTKAERNKEADKIQAQLDRARAELASVQSQLSTLTGK
jgi:hypothetical protein